MKFLSYPRLKSFTPYKLQYCINNLEVWLVNVASRHIVMASLICFDIDFSVAGKDSNNISSERACWNYY